MSRLGGNVTPFSGLRAHDSLVARAFEANDHSMSRL
jgi:hypothetical protein